MYLISYDISSNKLRNKVAKLLAGYGKRVQYSVFECRIERKRYQELYRRLVELTIDMEQGNIRIYYLSKDIESKIVTIGDPSFVSNQLDEDVLFF